MNEATKAALIEMSSRLEEMRGNLDKDANRVSIMTTLDPVSSLEVTTASIHAAADHLHNAISAIMLTLHHAEKAAIND